MTRRAVLYLRLSATVDDSTSMRRQAEDLEALAAREGWEVVRVLEDDGVSGRKARANAAEALRMIRDGDADVLAVWKLDRWTRQGLGALVALVDVLDERPGAVFVAYSDGLRSDQPSWRLIAGVLAEVARMEAENTSTRIRSSFDYRKRVGKFTGGPIPFGYVSAPAADGVGRVLEVDPAEAAIVREVAELILDGTSLSRVARELNARGVPTSKSPRRLAALAGAPDESLDPGRWTVSTIRVVWASHNLQGRTVHRGEPVRDPETGLPVQPWDAILDAETVTRLRARLLGSPGTPRRTRAARLLSGVAFCAHCGAKLYVNSPGKDATYSCPSSWNAGTCPSPPRMTARLLEAHVESRFLKMLGNTPEVRLEESLEDPGTASALADVELALSETTAALTLDGADYTALLPRLDALKARRAELAARPPAIASRLVPTGRTMAEAWRADEDPERRRSLLLLGLDHVTVSARNPAHPRSKFDPARVEFYWNS